MQVEIKLLERAHTFWHRINVRRFYVETLDIDVRKYECTLNM